MKDNNLKKQKKYKDIGLFVLLTFLIFYGFLSEFINPIFKYVDEFIVVYLFVYFILISGKNHSFYISKTDKNILICLLLLTIIGFFSNILSKFQPNVLYSILDWFSFMKFPLSYILLSKIIKYKNDELSYYDFNRISLYFKIILIIIMFIVIGNLIFDFNLAPTYSRFGIRSYSLGGHPSFASAVCAAIASYFMIDYKKNFLWIILALILSSATLRIKAIVWAFLMFLFIIFNREKKIKGKQVIMLLLVGIVIALCVSYKSIQFYFIDPNASRNNALFGSFKIANNYFPFGGGFATFGTIPSITSYSNAYYFTNLAYRWGFMKGASSFIGDGGWATEIAQFGYIGSFLVLIYLFNIYKDLKTNNKNYFYGYISSFVYILISSTSENALGSEYIVIFGIILAFISCFKSFENGSDN